MLLGAKILALKGLLIGGLLGRAARGRGRREAVPEADLAKVILEASLKDQYDCTKMLICALHAKPVEEMAEDEILIASTFGQMDAIDLTLPSVEFDLAALLGRKVGAERCNTIYSRCTVPAQDIMNNIRKLTMRKN